MARAGLCTIADKTKSATEMIDLATEAGAEAVEIWSRPDQISYPIDLSQLDRIREHAAERNIVISALGSYLGNQTELAGEFLTIENEVTIARALGTDLIRVWPGDRNFDEYEEDELSFLCSEIYAWGDTAAESGIRIVMERHNNTILNRWEGIDQVLGQTIVRPSTCGRSAERRTIGDGCPTPYTLICRTTHPAPTARTALACGRISTMDLWTIPSSAKPRRMSNSTGTS